MKKSSSFSFSQVASSGPTGSRSLNFSQIAAAAACGKGRKHADDSFQRWEEMRIKKLEAMKMQRRRAEERQKYEDASSIKYNHQESIQPPPLKPRNFHSQSPPAIMPKVSQHRCERQQLREHARYPHRRKISLDPNWYTDNIYSNQSLDDSDCDSIKRPLRTSASFSFYNHDTHPNNFHRYDFNGNSRSNNININITNTANTKLHTGPSFEQANIGDYEIKSPAHFQRHRNYPKSHSCSFAEQCRPRIDLANDEVVPVGSRSRSVPKSHSFSTSGSNRHVMRQYDMDLIEYQRYKRMMAQRGRNLPDSFDTTPPMPRYMRRICDREGCFSETCLVKNVNNSQNISINNNIINNNNLNAARIINEWDMRNQNLSFRDESEGRRRSNIGNAAAGATGGNNTGGGAGGGDASGGSRGDGFLRDTFIDDIDTFDDDDFIFNDGFSFQEFPCQPERPRRNRPPRNPYFSSMRYADFSDHFNRRNRVHDRDLDDLFRRERSKILIRNKFDKLNKFSEDFADDYQKSFEDLFVETKVNRHGHNLKQSKAMLEAKPPSKYDEDSDSCSTDLDLDDFNLDFEKYWDELEDKNLSTSSTIELATDEMIFDANNNPIERDSNNNPVHFINDIYKHKDFSPINSKRLEYFQKILPPKKMNIPSTARPLGLVTSNPPHSDFSSSSTKRPLTLNNIIESPLSTPKLNDSAFFHDESMDIAKFQIIPEKTGLKISPLYDFNHGNTAVRTFDGIYNNIMGRSKSKLKSTARPLLFW